MLKDTRRIRYEQLILPHIGAAHNLARWLTGNTHDAEDVVQESTVRAFRFIDTLRGDSRAWLLGIVRNTAYSAMEKRSVQEVRVDSLEATAMATPSSDPAAAALRNLDVSTIRAEMERLEPEAREIIVLREMEGLSYKEIAEVIGAPIGTVMSRLARARQLLRDRLSGKIGGYGVEV